MWPIFRALALYGRTCKGLATLELLSTVVTETSYLTRSFSEIVMKKLLAVAVVGMLINGVAMAAEQGTTGAAGGASTAATNVGLTLGVAAATAAAIGVAVNAAAGDDTADLPAGTLPPVVNPPTTSTATSSATR